MSHKFKKSSVSGSCEVCGKPFKGLIKRGLKCGSCGMMIHDDCAALARQIERIERYVEAMAGIQRLEDRAVAPTPVPIPELVADLGAV